MTTRSLERPARRQRQTGRPDTPGHGDRRPLRLGMVIAAVLLALGLVLVGTSLLGTGDAETVTSTPGGAADAERLQGQADAYEAYLESLRGRAAGADAERWSGQAEAYEQARRDQADVTATERLEGLARQEAGN
jgi:hypothetical protein